MTRSTSTAAWNSCRAAAASSASMLATSLQGVAVHINAFNFPVWGMLEETGADAAGRPSRRSSSRPPRRTWLAEAAFRMIVESNILPEGAVQFVAGSTGDLLDRLGSQDVVSFTGFGRDGADAALPIRTCSGARHASLPSRIRSTPRSSGPTRHPARPEFDAFIKEVHREMTAKAGQNAPLIRRIIVPEGHRDAVYRRSVRQPRQDGCRQSARTRRQRMGALASLAQRDDVRAKARIIASEARLVFGDMDKVGVDGLDAEKGRLPLAPALFLRRSRPRFPRARGRGVRPGLDRDGLPRRRPCGSPRQSRVGARWSPRSSRMTRRRHEKPCWRWGRINGRLYFANRDTGKEATGHGSPLPHMIHGGPGRAGGGEEMGRHQGRHALHAAHRHPGQPRSVDRHHQELDRPFEDAREGRASFPDAFRRNSRSATTLLTDSRQISLDDIEHFATFTGDNFYAHMDEAAANRQSVLPRPRRTWLSDPVVRRRPLLLTRRPGQCSPITASTICAS